MKKIVIAVGMLVSASVVAQDAMDAEAVQIYGHIQEIGYATSGKDGELIPAKAWQGTKILRHKDGTCIQIVHSDVKIVKAGNAQRAEFKVDRTQVECPPEPNVK